MEGLQETIDKAKCCLGDLGCRIKFKAEGGMEYSYTFLMAKLLTLYIFALENYQTLTCTLTETQLKAMRDHINRICGCDKTITTSSTGGYFVDGYIDSNYI